MEERTSAVCLLDYDWLGFDLDHTLIRYSLDNLHQLCYDCFRKYLIEEADYPTDLLDIPLNQEFIKKGNVVDRKRGNILKLDYAGVVERGYHGTKPITKEELERLYKNEPLANFQGLSTPDWWSLTTFFEVTLAWLFAVLVDLEDTKGKQHQEEVNIYYRDYQGQSAVLYDALLYNFGQWGKGWYFPAIQKDPSKYIFKQTKVRKWLEELRNVHRKRLFMVTNSFPEYLEVLANYAFGEDWRSLFDFISAAARKPSFFTQNNDYFEVLDLDLDCCLVSSTPTTELSTDEIFYGGNAKVLLDFMRKEDEKNNRHARKQGEDYHPKVLYFGDHLQYDVCIPLKFGWHTVAIVEELEELEKLQGLEFPSDHTPYLHDAENHPWSRHLDDNAYWGSYFFCDGDGDGDAKKRDSFWCQHIKQGATLYVPSLERFSCFSPDHTFTNNTCSAFLSCNN
ncbi:5'-nucleotidase [Balamuthia mandrillaris]